MTQSATSRKNRTALRIALCAQRLTDEHGLDGFTMDDLAAAADVSRRTLFNYYPGKVDAVLGEWPPLPEDAVDVFRAGGPDHDLVLDLRTLILTILEVDVDDRADIERNRRILRATPRLMQAVHERYLTLSGQIVALIEEREGPAFGAHRARIAIKLLASLLDTSLDAFLEDPDGRAFVHHYDESLRTARSLLGA